MTPHETLHKFDLLLSEERQALLTGQVAALAELAARKEKLAGQLTHAGLDAARLKVLKDRIAANAALLLAAQRGLGAARERLSQIRSGGAPLTTYGRDGRRMDIGRPASGLNHRA